MLRTDICLRDEINSLFNKEKFGTVVHLAAQTGVRNSLAHPEVYIDTNLVGFGNIIDACRQVEVEHLVYASSSSVYGRNEKIPYSESDPVERPASLYAATKRANELMAESYHHLYGLKCTGLRFFTVYGPWGRPDMAYFKFTRKLLQGETLPVFNEGQHRRDMTYIDDIIDGVLSAIRISGRDHLIFNLGNNRPVGLLEMIETLEEFTGCTARMELLPLQIGDVLETYADIERATRQLGFEPKVSAREGLKKFVDWYQAYYRSVH